MTSQMATALGDGVRRLREGRTIAIIGIALGVLAWLALPRGRRRRSAGRSQPDFRGHDPSESRPYRAARKSSAGGRSGSGSRAHSARSGPGPGRRDAEQHPHGRRARLDAPLRDAACLRRDRRDLSSARRREHRPRGDDADGRLLRIWGSVWSGSWAVGLLMAMLFGGLLALIHAVFSIHLRADQIERLRGELPGTRLDRLPLQLDLPRRDPRERLAGPERQPGLPRLHPSDSTSSRASSGT